MDGARSALLVATSSYEDERFVELRSPVGDVDMLAEVLADPNRGDFHVNTAVDEDRSEVEQRIERFFGEAKRQDMLLLYITGHGLLSEHRELFFAMPATNRELLHATALDSGSVRRLMDRSRSRQIVLILDCCHSGAFPKGFSAKGSRDVEVLRRFEGVGRITLTASTEFEYAFEGDRIDDLGQHETGSIFTRALIEGLQTGQADSDEDGRISVQELYQYVSDRVPDENAFQTPCLEGEMAGDLVIARNPRAVGAALPQDLRAAVKHPRAGFRVAAVRELRRLLVAGDAKEARAARHVLRELDADESEEVKQAARAALSAQPDTDPKPQETSNGERSDPAPLPDRPEYSTAHERRTRLVKLIDRQSEIAARLELDDERQTLDHLREKLADDTFKVLVLGDFSRGKSTFINALLGEKVLPVSVTPTTAVITEVKWGDEPRADLYPSQGSKALKPLEIGVEDLDAHIVLEGHDEPSAGDAPPKWSKAVVHWPLDLCRNGVEIIDSPGLNEHQSREKIAREYLAEVDAVLFIMSCQQLATKQEREVIEDSLLPAGHEHLFFVLNWINQIEEDDRADLSRRADTLVTFTQLGSGGIFMLDARGALRARLDGDAEAEQASGILELERALEHFLAVDRAKLKILPRARVLQRTVQAVDSRTIPERRRMLWLDLETLEKRVEDAREPLKHAEGERDDIIARLDSMIGGTHQDVVDRARAFYLELAGQIDGRVKEFEPKAKFKLSDRKKSADAVGEEIAAHVGAWAKDETREWLDTVLAPLMDERTAELTAELDRRAEDFIAHVDQIREALAAPEDGFEIPVDPQVRDISPSERLLAAAGGWIGGPGTMMLGAQGGFESMRKALVTHVAIGVLGIAAGMTPLGLSVLLLGSASWKTFRERSGMQAQIKSNAARGLAEQLRSTAADRANDIAESALAGLRAGRDAVTKGLDAEIEVIHEQINAVLDAKRAGEETVKKGREELEQTERELHDLDAELDDLISEIAMGKVSDDGPKLAHR